MADVINLSHFFPKGAKDVRPTTLAMAAHVDACKAFLSTQTEDSWNVLCHYVALDIERRHNSAFNSSITES